MTTRHLGRVPASALATAARRCFGSTTLCSVRASGFASVICLVKTEGVIIVAAVALALSSGWASAQAPLKPELERAAEARALVQACRELRPELAEHIDQAFEGWWVRDSEVADAVHVLYFGTPSPEQEARRQAFEALQGGCSSMRSGRGPATLKPSPSAAGGSSSSSRARRRPNSSSCPTRVVRSPNGASLARGAARARLGRPFRHKHPLAKRLLGAVDPWLMVDLL